MVMDMVMYGVKVTITFGQDRIHFLEDFMIHLIHFGDIMTPFIMVMVMVTDITHGGGHIILGTIITLMAEI